MDMFGMSRTFLFHFLLYYLFNSFVSNLLAASTSKCVPRIGKPQPEVKVIATSEKATAFEIYRQHGVADKKNNMCKSADGKTRFINGYSLCKNAAKGDAAMLNDDSEIVDAHCSWVKLSPKPYKHAELANNWFSKKNYDNDDDECILRVGCFSKNGSNNNYGHVMVECIKKDNKNIRSKAFRLLHAKDDIYYIFEANNSYPDLLKTALLKVDNKDYPTIIVKATENPFEVDNIFGRHGVMGSKNRKHVCQTDKSTNMLVGQPLCGPALAKYRPRVEMLDINSSCINVDLQRLTPKDYSWGYKLRINVRGIKCWFSDLNSDHILITNVPEKGYYYILTPIHSYTNRKNKLTRYWLLSIEKFEKNTNGEIMISQS